MLRECADWRMDCERQVVVCVTRSGTLHRSLRVDAVVVAVTLPSFAEKSQWLVTLILAASSPHTTRIQTARPNQHGTMSKSQPDDTHQNASIRYLNVAQAAVKHHVRWRNIALATLHRSSSNSGSEELRSGCNLTCHPVPMHSRLLFSHTPSACLCPSQPLGKCPFPFVNKCLPQPARSQTEGINVPTRSL